MLVNMVGAFIRNKPFGTEIAFAKGLRQIGIGVNEVDTSYSGQVLNPDGDATIVFKWMENDYWNDLLSCSKGPRILYQPDDYRFPHIREMVQKMRPYCDHILTFDKFGAENAQKDFGYKTARQMHVTADNTLYENVPYNEDQKDIDFCFVGSFTGGQNHASRRRMVQVLHENGFKVGVMTDVYDISLLAQTYARSKVVLNHATDVGQPFGMGYGMQCRHFEAGMVGACILSNHILDEDETGLKSFVRFHDEKSLLEQADSLLHDPSMRASYSRALSSELRFGHLPYHRALEIRKFIGECNAS